MLKPVEHYPAESLKIPLDGSITPHAAQSATAWRRASSWRRLLLSAHRSLQPRSNLQARTSGGECRRTSVPRQRAELRGLAGRWHAADCNSRLLRQGDAEKERASRRRRQAVACSKVRRTGGLLGRSRSVLVVDAVVACDHFHQQRWNDAGRRQRWEHGSVRQIRVAAARTMR